MASKFRNLIAAKLALQGSSLRELEAKMSLVAGPNPIRPFRITLPWDDSRSFPRHFDTDDRFLPSVVKDGKKLAFDLPRAAFIGEVIKVGLRQDLHSYKWHRNGLFPEMRGQPSKVFVEFSSPNVAKPFHMGHLRSTIVGNFVANIHEAFGHEVVRVNFLGDWGTQFGFLACGLRNTEDLDQLLGKADPLHELYKVYVEVNKLASIDASVAEAAKAKFSLLESGDPELRLQWQKIRRITVDELEKVYSRLGIKFDLYHGEAMYGDLETRTSTLNLLNKIGLLKNLDDGRRVIDLDDNNRRVAITKSDGSSLYVTRDIAAALDRLHSAGEQPCKLMYVVENGQSHHFENLFAIVSKLLNQSGADAGSKCQFQHVKFGRIQGMSTRRGTAVFLKDILDEARDRMREKMLATSTTKVASGADFDQVSDRLGISAVLINDLKLKKTQNYEFSWDAALQNTGNSGIKLQYTHSRLHSLIEANHHLLRDLHVENVGSFECLREPEAIQLVLRLSQFDERLRESYRLVEPSILVHYLFGLCTDTSKAIKVLKVKGEEQECAFLRLCMFKVAKNVLNFGMSVLGVEPLNEM